MSTTSWYKYTKSKYADMLVNEGRLRVGTLLDYQNTEKHRAGILDEEEGMRVTFKEVTERQVWTPQTIPEYFSRTGVIVIEGNARIEIEDCTFETHEMSENVYTYCVSKVFDERLFEEFEADACVEILPGPFERGLSKAMLPHGEYLGYYECEYVGRRQEDGSGLIHPIRLKDTRYTHQAEVRMAWRPHGSLTSAFVDVQNIELTSAVRRRL